MAITTVTVVLPYNCDHIDPSRNRRSNISYFLNGRYETNLLYRIFQRYSTSMLPGQWSWPWLFREAQKVKYFNFLNRLCTHSNSLSRTVLRYSTSEIRISWPLGSGSPNYNVPYATMYKYLIVIFQVTISAKPFDRMWIQWISPACSGGYSLGHQWRSESPTGPATAGGAAGLKGPAWKK